MINQDTTRRGADEICAKPQKISVSPTPSTTPIYPAAVYECESLAQADQLLAGTGDGFVYQRDGHPNAVVLAEQCRQLHGGDESNVAFAYVTSTGMSALSLAMTVCLKSGDHVLLSDQLYGRTTRLVNEELARFGVEASDVNMCDLERVANSIRSNTKLLVVETVANPLLHVADLKSLSDLAHNHGARLLVDNTFATPLLARPMELGADLVMESMSKILNGHGDLMMGLLCGRPELKERARNALSSWGMTASPFDCWLASRGLATAHLRIERACENALQLASWLESQPQVSRVYHPGLQTHPSYQIAERWLGRRRLGSMISCEFVRGKPDVEFFVEHSKSIRFCPSLGEIATTVSHPRSTSHRGLAPAVADGMGITEGLLRISCGIESFDFLRNEFESLLAAMDGSVSQ